VSDPQKTRDLCEKSLEAMEALGSNLSTMSPEAAREAHIIIDQYAWLANVTGMDQAFLDRVQAVARNVREAGGLS
jgi:hypothetical protein